MSLWGAIADGFVGTLVLTTMLRAASELGLTRMDIPFLLGTALTGHRERAKVLGSEDDARDERGGLSARPARSSKQLG
jgi:hypothetical protein